VLAYSYSPTVLLPNPSTCPLLSTGAAALEGGRDTGAGADEDPHDWPAPGGHRGQGVRDDRHREGVVRGW